MDCERVAVPFPRRLTVSGEPEIDPPVVSVMAKALELDDASRTDEPCTAAAMLIPAPVPIVLVRLTVLEAVTAEFTVIAPELLKLAEPEVVTAAFKVIAPVLLKLAAPEVVNASLKMMEPELVRARVPNDCVVPEAVVILPELVTLRFCPEANDTNCNAVEPLLSVIALPP